MTYARNGVISGAGVWPAFAAKPQVTRGEVTQGVAISGLRPDGGRDARPTARSLLNAVLPPKRHRRKNARAFFRRCERLIPVLNRAGLT